MNREGRSTLSALQRVQEFLRQHPTLSAPELGEQVQELDEVVRQLLAESVDQARGMRFASAQVKSTEMVRQALYLDHMKPLAQVAREIFSGSGLDRAFRLTQPPTSEQALLAAAGAMVVAAEQQKDAFLRRGLPAGFIEQLEAAATAVAEVQRAKVEYRRQHIAATAAVKRLLRHGLRAVRLLNAILSPRLAKDPVLLAAWRSAKRVRPTSAAGDGEGATTPVLEKVA
ncbi:MAG: hypothetical protein WD801_00375 [Gemmatimonadaceae bacterium]